MRVQARIELASGQLDGLWRHPARQAERSGPAINSPLPQGSLFNGDMGYFTLEEMRRRGKLGQFWMTQAKASLTIIDQRGQYWDAALVLTGATGRAGGCAGVCGQTGALASSVDRGPRLG